MIGIAAAVVVTRAPRLEPVANAVSSIGLTIPSFALIGLLLPVLGLGFWPSLVAVGFYAIFPVLRNAVVGLQGVDADLLESARGMGMSEAKSLLAGPAAARLAGDPRRCPRLAPRCRWGSPPSRRTSSGPASAAWIFTGLQQTGGKNGTNYALSATIGVVIIALIFDLLLLLLGRATISKGIRV